MDIQQDVSLKKYLTMQIGGHAKAMVKVASAQDVKEAVHYAKKHNLRHYVVGGGSNIIAHDGLFEALIIKNNIKGIDVVSETNTTVTIKAGAGELWDDLVALSVKKNLTGISAMSLIPGTCGAAPVQNIGAYGQEVADTLVELEAYDTEEEKIVTITNKQCEFDYRSSIFRDKFPGRFIILSITLSLSRSAPKPPFYAGLQKYFDEHGITNYTNNAIREGVSAIRRSKLPDPAYKPNAGSFFKNAIIPQSQLQNLLAEHPSAPYYDMNNGTYKVPTGWLIDQCGLKGKFLHGMRVNPANALVLINESAKGYADLAAARTEIIAAVYDKFGITIEQEPLEI